MGTIGMIAKRIFTGYLDISGEVTDLGETRVFGAPMTTYSVRTDKGATYKVASSPPPTAFPGNRVKATITNRVPLQLTAKGLEMVVHLEVIPEDENAS